MLDITRAFSMIWDAFVYAVEWMRTHGIFVTIGGEQRGASFFTLTIASYVITLVLSYIPPFDEEENENE